MCVTTSCAVWRYIAKPGDVRLSHPRHNAGVFQALRLAEGTYNRKITGRLAGKLGS